MILRLTILLVIYCTTLPSFAMTVHNLNTANIAITKKVSGEELNDLFQQGLQQVLIKTSGNPGITSLTGIQSTIANAKNWVSSYRFKQVANQSIISITYNQKSIDNLLQKNNQGTWGNHRPLTLIWVNSIKSGIISAHQNDNQYKAITQTANDRGLPILLPPETANQHHSSDLTLIEQNNSTRTPTDLLDLYHTDAALTGNIENSTMGEIIHWQYNDRSGNTLSWSNTGLTSTIAIKKGIDQLANTLADQEAFIHNQGLKSVYYIYINNVNSTKDYARIIQQLKNNNNISSYQTEELTSNQLKIKLTSALNAPEVTRNIAKNSLLQPSKNQVINNSSTTITFNWNS
jgi:uncharacterized protein